MSDIELLSELRSRFSLFDDHEQPYYHALSEAIRAMNMVQWHPSSEHPRQRDIYLVTRQILGIRYRDILTWQNDIYDPESGIDNHGPGWIDESMECGWSEARNVVAWCALPELWEGRQDE